MPSSRRLRVRVLSSRRLRARVLPGCRGRGLRASQPSTLNEGREVSSSKEGRGCRGRSILASQPSTPALQGDEGREGDEGDEGREGDEVSSSKEGRGCRGRSILASQPHAPALRKAVKEMKAVKARKWAVLEERAGAAAFRLVNRAPSPCKRP